MFVAADQSGSADLFVVGSFWLPLIRVPDFEAKVLQIRIEQKYWREAHFTHLKKTERAYDFCKSLLQAALDPQLNTDFAVIVAANNEALTEQFHANSQVKRDVTFMYELISRRYRWWRIESSPYVIFDDITHKDCCDPSTEEPEDSVAHAHIRDGRKWLNKYTGKPAECFAPCRSHISSAIQVADLLAGMTSLRWCIKTRAIPAPNQARLSLLEWFEGELGSNLGVETLPSNPHISVWKHTSLA